jgi:chloramphenicol 3-O-phosphotransferase
MTMKHFIKPIIFILCLLSYLHPQGTVILLNGTSSAGKSAISRALIQKLGESSWTIIDADYLSKTPALANAMKTLALEFIETELNTSLTQKEKEKIMQEGYSELNEQHFWLPDEKYSKLDDYLEEQIVKQVYKSAINVAKTGKNVIVPTVFESSMNDEFDSFSIQDNVLMILVFCPFAIIPQRISQRNEAALRPGATAEEKADIRPISAILRQFSGFYSAGNRTDMPVLEELTLDQINEAWKSTANEIDLFKDITTEENIKEFGRKNYKEMMDNFGFKKGQSSIKIQSRFYYDLIVNNGINSAEQCAAQIKEFIEQNTEFKAFQKNVQTVKQRGWVRKIKYWVKKRFTVKTKSQFNWRTKKQVFLLRG